MSLVLILSLFLLGVLGLAVDLTNMWFHRQAATAAADAACLAGAMDMLSTSAGVTPSAAGFTDGTASNCVSSPKATMCSYANDNGYNGKGLVSTAASNAVSWTFPSSVPGVTAGSGTYPFLQVTIAENVKTFFMGLLTHKAYQEVAVSTTCGIAQILSPAPMIVLAPSGTSFTYSGGSGVTIVGGPARALQINSTTASANTSPVDYSPSGVINTSQGGPNYTGSDVGVSASEASPQETTNIGFNGGTTGTWRENTLPIADPYSSVPVPASIKSETPADGTSGKSVAYETDGCPDHGGNGCMEMSPGYYPSGISLDGWHTYIFDPGIYYLNGSLNAGGSSTMRMATLSTTKQTDGVMFYFLTGSLNISGCSGCSSSSINNVNSTALTCNGAAPNSDLGMASTLSGNVLWAQCTTKGTYVDSTDNPGDSTGSIRGLMIFQDHGDSTNPSFSGSGALAFSGALYFHSTGYADDFEFSGASGVQSYVLGEIVTDKVTFSGSSAIKLLLNPTPSVELSKVGMFQ